MPDETTRERELISWLELKEANAINATDDAVSEARQNNYNRYLGEPYGDEEEGYSKIVTREIFEAIEWTMPGLLRALLNGGNVCAFRPVSKDDIEAAVRETRICNNIIYSLNNAWELFNAWCRDTLMYPNGYAKVWWNEIEDSRLETHDGLAAQEVALLEENNEIEVIDVSPMPDRPDMFTVIARYTDVRGDIKCEAVPPEEALVDNSARFIDLDKARWVCHHSQPTRGEVAAMGFDDDVVMEQLPSASKLLFSTENTNRAKYTDEEPLKGAETTSMMIEDQRVDWYECYGYVDFDDDGQREYRKMVHSGNHLMVNEETTFQPLCAMSMIPQSHRHTGLDMNDIAEDMQRVGTTLTRQMLDNLYRTNRPRQFAGRGVNLAQLMSYAPFGVVEMDNPANVQTEQIQSVVQAVLPALQNIRERLETRTGHSRLTTGMDAESMAASTMGAFFKALNQANQRQEYILRGMAETGVRSLIWKVHQLLRLHPSDPTELQVGGEFIEVNPANWLERNELVASVGLGTGSQEEQLASNAALLDLQIQALPQGLSTPDRIHNNLAEIVEIMGKPSADVYFLDPLSDEAEELVATSEQTEQEAETKQQAQIQEIIQAEVVPQMAKISADANVAQKKLVLEVQRLRTEVEKERNRHFEAMAKLEVEEAVDIAGEGVSNATVTPLVTGGKVGA